MLHDHHTHHHHPSDSSYLNKAFIIGITLNILFVVAEFSAGLWFNSMTLLSDAGHNLTDVVSLVLAMLAFRLARVKGNKKYTYGYKKSTVLVSLLNAIILLVAVGAILVESVEKLKNPSDVPGIAIAWVAGIGVLVNGFTALLFFKDKKKDLNVKGAYLHMLADAFVSIGVVVSGVIIAHTELYILDPIIGIVVSIVILISTWYLLHNSIRLSLDGVPVNIDMQDVYKTIQEIPGVDSAHHLHIWAISTTETALTAHIVIDDFGGMNRIKNEIKEKLKSLEIRHATLEFEHQTENCMPDCRYDTQNCSM